jgi:biotin transport system substrate-specific component
VLLSIASLVKVPLPFTPVPVTLQVFVVALAAGLLGPARSSAAVLLYVILGVAGAPVFANAGTGFLYMAGPTGGYLLGFLGAAWIIGVLREVFPSKKLAVIFFQMAAGVAAVYLLGGCWLSVGWGWDAPRIWTLAIAPFVGADVAKVFMAALIVKGVAEKGGGMP